MKSSQVVLTFITILAIILIVLVVFKEDVSSSSQTIPDVVVTQQISQQAKAPPEQELLSSVFPSPIFLPLKIYVRRSLVDKTLKPKRRKQQNARDEQNQLEQVASCARRFSDGYFWSATNASCEQRLQSFGDDSDHETNSLLAFEVSKQEMACRHDDNNNNNTQASWDTFGFVNDSAATKTIERALSMMDSQQGNKKEETGNNNNKRRQTRQVYSDFFRDTSWLFRQWLPWKPAPDRAVVLSSQGDDRLFFSAFHDNSSHLRNLYRVENFCLSPFSGEISGVFPDDGAAVAHLPYEGLDDTRNHYHGHAEPEFRDFLNNVRRLGDPVGVGGGEKQGKETLLVYDRRPVVLVPISRLSRWSLAHTMHRLLSVLGITSLLRSANKRHFQNNNEHDAADNLNPLIVFVLSRFLKHDEERNMAMERRRTNAWGFFYRVLGLPWAVVMMPPSSSRRSQQQQQQDDDTAKYVDMMKSLTRHGCCKTKNSTSSTSHRQLCFRFGVAYQHCRNCSLGGRSEYDILNDKESEPYAFGHWMRPSPDRTRLVMEMRSRFDRCLSSIVPRSSSSYSSSSVQKNSQQLPRKIFFDVRTQTRSIRDLGIFADELQERLRQTFFQQQHRQHDEDDDNVPLKIVFREPWRSSRVKYLDDVRTSSIFVGVHGAAFSQVSLLPARSVVVEFAWGWSFCPGPRPACWFDLYSDVLSHDHWVVPVPFQIHDRDVDVPFPRILQVLVQSVCRWMQKQNRNEADVDGVGASQDDVQQRLCSEKLRDASRRNFYRDGSYSETLDDGQYRPENVAVLLKLRHGILIAHHGDQHQNNRFVFEKLYQVLAGVRSEAHKFRFLCGETVAQQENTDDTMHSSRMVEVWQLIVSQLVRSWVQVERVLTQEQQKRPSPKAHVVDHRQRVACLDFQEQEGFESCLFVEVKEKWR